MSENNEDDKLTTTEEKITKELTREHVRFRINSKTLKNVLSFRNATNFTGIVKMFFKEDGIEYAMVNTSHDIMILTTMKKELCDEYSVNVEMSLDIDLDKVLTFLKISTIKDSFLFEYDSEVDSGHFNMTIGYVTRKAGLCGDCDVFEKKVPTLDLPASFTILVEDLKKFLSQSGEITDTFSITTTSEKVQLFAESDVDKVDFPVTVQNLVSNSTHKSIFSIEYFNDVVNKFKNLFDTVDMSIGSDYPVQIIGSKMKKTGTRFLNVVVLIAPRIESE